MRCTAHDHWHILVTGKLGVLITKDVSCRLAIYFSEQAGIGVDVAGPK